MIATLISLAIALFLAYFSLDPASGLSVPFLELVMIAVPSLMFVSLPLVFSLTLNPLQRAEQKVTPHLVSVLKRDWGIRLGGAVFLLFLFGSFLLSLVPKFNGVMTVTLRLQIWLVMLGITLDVIRRFLYRILDYLNPYFVVRVFRKRALNCLVANNDEQLCHWIDALAETGIRGIERENVSTCQEVLAIMQEVMREYFVSERSFIHFEGEEGEKMETSKVSFFLFYVLERMELIYRKAMRHRLDPVCNYLIGALGKIAIAAAQYDLSVVPHPIQCMSRCTREGQQEKIHEIGLKTTCTLLEVAKGIVRDVDLKYVDLKETFLSLISTLHEVAKTTYQLDKKTKISLLIHPFADLKELIKHEKLKTHQDVPLIAQQIDGVIEEFKELAQVMQTIPFPARVEKREEEEPES